MYSRIRVSRHGPMAEPSVVSATRPRFPAAERVFAHVGTLVPYLAERGEVRWPGGWRAGGQCRALLRRRRQCRVRSHLRRFSSLPSSGHARSTVAGGALLLTLLSSSSPLAPPLCCYYPLFRHHKQASEMFATFKLVPPSSLPPSVRPPSASYALACAALLLLLLWYSIVAPQRNECTRPRRPPRPRARRGREEGAARPASDAEGQAGGRASRPARSRWPRASGLPPRSSGLGLSICCLPKWVTRLTGKGGGKPERKRGFLISLGDVSHHSQPHAGLF